MAGRKPEHFVTRDNTQIKGLARRADGRWRVIGTNITFVEPDERLAVQKYLARYAPRDQRKSIELPLSRPTPGTPIDELPVLARVNKEGEWIQVLDEAAAYAGCATSSAGVLG